MENKYTDDTISSTKQLMDSPELDKLIKEVIEEEKLDLGPAEIGAFLVYPDISKMKVSKTIKANKEVKHYSGNDYLIEMSGDVWDMLDKKTKKTLVLFNLLQVDPTFNSKKQEWKMNLRKPDFNDFYSINDKQGNVWYKTIQATVSSLYDLDPKQESKVQA